MLARKSARSTETVVTKLPPTNQNLKFGPQKRFHDKPFTRTPNGKAIKNLSTKGFSILMRDPIGVHTVHSDLHTSRANPKISKI